MNNIFILREIAKFDRKVWKLFSLLNREMNKYFCIKGYEYEMCFRKVKKDKSGIYYTLDKLLHRSDGPAVIWNDSSESWFINGKYHRLDGPAIIRINYSSWYDNGKLHRLDGPAIEYVEENDKKYNQWWNNGKKIMK